MFPINPDPIPSEVFTPWKLARKNKSKAKRTESIITPTHNRFRVLGDLEAVEKSPPENTPVGIFKYKTVKRKLEFETPKAKWKSRPHPKRDLKQPDPKPISNIYTSGTRATDKCKSDPLFSNPNRILNTAKVEEPLTFNRKLSEFNFKVCKPNLHDDIPLIDIRKLFEAGKNERQYELVCKTTIINRENIIKCICGKCEIMNTCIVNDTKSLDQLTGISELFAVYGEGESDQPRPAQVPMQALYTQPDTTVDNTTDSDTNIDESINIENTQNPQTNVTHQIEDTDNLTNDTIKIAQWNAYGITDSNWSFKKDILLGTKAEIICVNETHFRQGKQVSMEGYTAKFHNRKRVNNRAKKGFGGVAIFIKNTLYKQFDIDIIDEQREDILGIRLEDKTSGKDIIIYSVYITPSNSTAGAPAYEMYTHLLTKSYEYNLADIFLIVGDLNSRIGSKEDFIEILDPTIPKRQVIDFKFVKKNAEPFLEFLNESVCCVLNGRFHTEDNNFTCIRNGESVVDWFVTPITNFKWFKNFKVHTVHELIQTHNLANQIEKLSDVSDHSIITTEVLWSTFDLMQSKQTSPTHIPNQESNPKIKRKMPSHFLESQMATISIQVLIEKQLEKIENQRQVDDFYKQFLTVYFDELTRLKMFKNAGPPKKRNKPW